MTEDAKLHNFDFHEAPMSLDYKKDLFKKLQPQFTFNSGFLTKVEYFANIDKDEYGQIVYIQPVLKVDISYYVDDSGYVHYRDTTRKWVKNDGNYSNEEKHTRKYYSKRQAVSEGRRRRQNIFNNLLIDIVYNLVIYDPLINTNIEAELTTLPFLDLLDNEIDKFIKGNIEPLIVGVTTADTSTHNWLTLDLNGAGTSGVYTLQQYVIDTLLKAQTQTNTTYS